MEDCEEARRVMPGGENIMAPGGDGSGGGPERCISSAPKLGMMRLTGVAVNCERTRNGDVLHALLKEGDAEVVEEEV